MSKAFKLLNQVRKDEEGAALIEYTILLGVIAVAVIGFATTIRNVEGARCHQPLGI
jgi:pilus assembly protein Flp/PilA